MPDTAFPSRLRALRTRAGLSQRALALAIGSTQPHVADMEAGRKSPSWDMVCRLARALEVSTEEFREERKRQ